MSEGAIAFINENVAWVEKSSFPPIVKVILIIVILIIGAAPFIIWFFDIGKSLDKEIESRSVGDTVIGLAVGYRVFTSAIHAETDPIKKDRLRKERAQLLSSHMPMGRIKRKHARRTIITMQIFMLIVTYGLIFMSNLVIWTALGYKFDLLGILMFISIVSAMSLVLWAIVRRDFGYVLRH